MCDLRRGRDREPDDEEESWFCEQGLGVLVPEKIYCFRVFSECVKKEARLLFLSFRKTPKKESEKSPARRSADFLSRAEFIVAKIKCAHGAFQLF